MKRMIAGVTSGVLVLALLSASPGPVTASDPASADLAAIERGRYLVKVSGCNDCHTRGYLLSDGTTPVADWLTGDDLGWHGPWGTTYGTNLRLFMANLSEAQWIEAARTLRRRPPMPWFNLNEMQDADLAAIYHFTRSLGEAGPPAPAALPPGIVPPPPFAQFPSPPPGQ